MRDLPITCILVIAVLVAIDAFIGFQASGRQYSETPATSTPKFRIACVLIAVVSGMPSWYAVLFDFLYFVSIDNGASTGNGSGENTLYTSKPDTVIACALIITLLLLLIPGHTATAYRRHTDAAWLNKHDPGPLHNAVTEYGIEPAPPDEMTYQGYRMVTQDASKELYGTSLGDAYHAAMGVNLGEAHYRGQLYGFPGSGLEHSGYGQRGISSGMIGEKILAGIIAAFNKNGNLNVIGFYSLYGLDRNGRRTNADIDCVLLGMDYEGRLHAWFVDAKYYKGGKDTKYICMGNSTIARISKSQHAFVTGPDGRVTLATSSNMLHQQSMWEPLLRKHNIDAQWVICFVPGPEGTPDVSNLQWAADRHVRYNPDSPSGTSTEYQGIPVVSASRLVGIIHAMHLADTAYIPDDAIKLFKRYVKWPHGSMRH